MSRSKFPSNWDELSDEEQRAYAQLVAMEILAAADTADPAEPAPDAD